MSSAHPTSRIHGLDTLRTAAIVLVFMYHYMVFVSGEETFGFLSNIGWVGVDLFFALSGYLIGNQIFAGMRTSREGAGKFSLALFYLRRFLRTLPNYYVVLALYFCVPAVQGKGELPALWKFLTFTQNYHLLPGTAFSHAWSLCIEEQFYLLLPLAALLIGSVRKSKLLGWSVVLATVLGGMVLRATLWTEYVGGGAEPDSLMYYKYIYYSSFCRFDELLAGVAIALLKNFHQPAWQRLTAKGNWLFAAGVAATGISFYLHLRFGYAYWMTVFGYPLLALSFGLLLLAAVSPGSLLARTRVPGAAQVAAWSYAIYLTHKPVGVLLRPHLATLGFPVTGAAGTGIVICLCGVGGWLLYRLVETPFMRLRDRYVASNFAPPAPAVPMANQASL